MEWVVERLVLRLAVRMSGESELVPALGQSMGLELARLAERLFPGFFFPVVLFLASEVEEGPSPKHEPEIRVALLSVPNGMP